MSYNPWYFKVLNGVLIKKQKPCLPGMQVHVKTMGGCFTVKDVKIDYFSVMKSGQEKKIPWEYFLCLKGQGNSPETLLKRDIKTSIAIINKSSISNIILVEEMTSLLRQYK
jgi:hypothetical protein